MNPRVKKLWVDALRSGEYEQCSGVLANLDDPDKPAYCCLGVLCEVAIKDGLYVETKDESNRHRMWLRRFYDGKDTQLPRSVWEWAELDSQNPVLFQEEDVDGRPFDVLCSTANDEYELSFTEIADLIEKNL